MSNITWTAREAMACSLCWAGFYDPLNTGNAHHGSPEMYWLSIAERARCDYREHAGRLLLLAVARGEAVAIMPPNALTDRDMRTLAKR